MIGLVSIKDKLWSSAAMMPNADDVARFKTAIEMRARVMRAKQALMTGPRATPPKWKAIKRFLRGTGLARCHPRTGYRWGP